MKEVRNHTWSKSHRKSIPCELVKQHLRDEGVAFIEEWEPLPDRRFSIDIAFPDIKVGIEINGNQHYDYATGRLAPYYQTRHNLIVESGWKLYEMHFSVAYNLGEITKIVSGIEPTDYTEFIKQKLQRSEEWKSYRASVLPLGQKNKRNAELKWEPFKAKILASEIDFSKRGWVKQVSEILSISPQKVTPWMKRHLPAFYDQNCNKRHNEKSDTCLKPFAKSSLRRTRETGSRQETAMPPCDSQMTTRSM